MRLQYKKRTNALWGASVTLEVDLTNLNYLLDEKNRRYLTGKIRFLDEQAYSDFLSYKLAGVAELQVRHGQTGEWVYGVMPLAGEWNYESRTVELDVKPDDDYVKLEQILDDEYNSTFIFSKKFYDFDSYADIKWANSEIVDDVYPDYEATGVIQPDDWNSEKNYLASNLDDTSGTTYYYGTGDSFVYHNLKRWVCLVDNTNSEPTATNPNWLDITISTVLQYAQERAQFEFEGAEYDEFNQYWYKASKTTATYDRSVAGYSVKRALTGVNSLLSGSGFTLATDWLKYATSVNADYEDIFIINTEIPEGLTLSELIGIIEQLFNCEHRLEDGQLTFKHWSELREPYKGVYPLEHDLKNRTDINTFSKEQENYYEHRLKFSASPLGTHDDSIIKYDNEFADSNTVKASFDVDFVFAINKGGKTCPVTLDSRGWIKREGNLYNPDFLPSLIHENFYLVGREYLVGELNENPVSLELAYSEETDAELDPTLDFFTFDITKNVLLKHGLGIYKSITYSIEDNNYKAKLAIQQPYQPF